MKETWCMPCSNCYPGKLPWCLVGQDKDNGGDSTPSLSLSKRYLPCRVPTGSLILQSADNFSAMGSYFRGDVLLAPLCLSRERGWKVRPVVVLGTSGQSELLVSPVSSTPPFEGPPVPLCIDDFSEGGLDLMGESYLVAGRICRIRVSDVLGKKGRLTKEAIRDLLPLPAKEA
jgi:hypothetical protein